MIRRVYDIPAVEVRRISAAEYLKPEIKKPENTKGSAVIDFAIYRRHHKKCTHLSGIGGADQSGG
jgi:hypothetical protein